MKVMMEVLNDERPDNYQEQSNIAADVRFIIIFNFNFYISYFHNLKNRPAGKIFTKAHSKK